MDRLDDILDEETKKKKKKKQEKAISWSHVLITRAV